MKGRERAIRYARGLLFAIVGFCAPFAAGGAQAQQNIGSTALSQNQVSRDLAGAAGPLKSGDSVYRDEVVRTGEASLAKLVFLDSTNLAIGPISRVTLDRFVYAGATSAQELTVNLAKGVFRFTTGALDKRAYTISTPTASIGVRGTVLDIGVSSPQTRVTLVEGQALLCPRRPGITFEQQRRNCARAERGAHCDCVELNNPGQTASAKKVGGAIQASLISTPVNFASLCGGNAALCSDSTYAMASPAGGGGFPSGALCGH
ncbi:MAG TPA: FecR domain-containing protein [Roseiarcus sp.]|jgi:hypothetical protein|nr:FecR domain-containing protein [Roseiarcus sp.]